MVAITNPINNTVGASNSGVTNTLTITNPSNTASSQANEVITVGGGTAGDPFTTYTVSGATSWSQGIDNSVSDNYVLAASTALGTTNVVSATTGGAVSFVLGNVDITRSASGATVSDTISNTSNTSSSNALQQIIVAGTSANDPFSTYTVSGTTNWSQGIDNSVTGDPFVLSASTALGTTNIISAATAGQVSMPLQPCFQVYLNTTVSNVTGDSTTYNLLFDTTAFDQNSNITLNSSSKTIFTAPITGKYLFSGTLNFAWDVGAGAQSAIYSMIHSNGNTYRIVEQANMLAITAWGYAFSFIVSMTAADTVYLTAHVAGANGKSADFRGLAGAIYLNYWSGTLIA